MARLYFSPALQRRMPPWLRRVVGTKLMAAIGDQLDNLVDRTVDGVKLRFPTDESDDLAISYIGAERRIRRGPGESEQTYARRLRRWWDDHRGRGGPYALLRQLDAFFESWLNVRMDVVYASGTRRWIDDAVPGVITRDAVVWDADGTGKWARTWVFFYVSALIPSIGDTIVTSDDDELITEGGDTLVTDGTISPDALSASEEEIFRTIPREWSAAHIDKIHVVLLWDDRRLWNYPQPVPTWAEWGTTSTWSEPPTVLEITE